VHVVVPSSVVSPGVKRNTAEPLTSVVCPVFVFAGCPRTLSGACWYSIRTCAIFPSASSVVGGSSLVLSSTSWPYAASVVVVS